VIGESWIMKYGKAYCWACGTMLLIGENEGSTYIE